MARSKYIAPLLVLGVTLAGCAPVGHGLSPSYNPGLESANQPVVQRSDYVFDLNAGGNGVGDQELYRLANWFETLRLGYGDRVSVDQGSGYADPQVRQDVARVAAEFGLLLVNAVPVTAGAVQSGTARVIVSRSTAHVPQCPNWDDADRLGEGTLTSSNYGCATNSNLAAMIADPSHLVLGEEGSGVGDPTEVTKSIKGYRSRIQTGFEGGLKSEKTGGK